MKSDVQTADIQHGEENQRNTNRDRWNLITVIIVVYSKFGFYFESFVIRTETTKPELVTKRRGRCR